MRILFLSLTLLLCSFSAYSQGSCSASAPIAITASGNTQVVALGVAAIKICHVSLSSSTATDITLKYGTGSDCGTGTTSLTGAYKSVVTMSLGFGTEAGPLVPAGKAFCISSSATATIGGLVTYRPY